MGFTCKLTTEGGATFSLVGWGRDKVSLIPRLHLLCDPQTGHGNLLLESFIQLTEGWIY